MYERVDTWREESVCCLRRRVESRAYPGVENVETSLGNEIAEAHFDGGMRCPGYMICDGKKWWIEGNYEGDQV